MKLKKGTKVEVFTQNGVPPGSWRYAEIINGNGQYYSIKYYDYIARFGDSKVEKVCKKAVRPCPPMVDVLDDWVVGDVVEVFHDFSWKMGIVLKVLGRDCLVVRLVGSGIEVETSECNVRVRLCWQDGEWVVIGKGSDKAEDLRFRLPSSRTNHHQSQKTGFKADQRVKANNLSSRNITCTLIPSPTPKRKPSDYQEDIKAYPRQIKKLRVEEKHNSRHYLNIFPQPQLPIKVDDVENSVTSSVGSCSVNVNYSHKFHHLIRINESKDYGNEYSDAESYSQLNTEELPEEIHRLELDAYRRIIEALHASGPQ